MRFSVSASDFTQIAPEMGARRPFPTPDRLRWCRLHHFQSGVPGDRAEIAIAVPHRYPTIDGDCGDQAIHRGPDGDTPLPTLPIDFCRGNEQGERDRIAEDWNREERRPKRVALQPRP